MGHKPVTRTSSRGGQSEGGLLELAEDVCVLGEDPAGLQHRYTESEGTAQGQVAAGLFRKPFHHHLAVQQSARLPIYRGAGEHAQALTMRRSLSRGGAWGTLSIPGGRK